MDYILTIILSYLIGSLNFAIVLSKLIFKKDIREHGSKNAGSTNAFRVLGGKVAICVLLGDIFKAIFSVLLGNYIASDIGKLLAGIFVILGHIYPVYFNFKGGKGVATVVGMLMAFDFRMFLGFVIIFFFLLFLTKYVSLSAMIASLVLPIGMYVFYNDFIFVATGVLVFLGIVYMHRANIKRLLNNTENKISFKKKWGNFWKFLF